MPTRPNHDARDHAGGSSKANPLPSVTVLGVGQMGLVCAGLLADELSPRARVTCWGHAEREVGDLAQTRRSPRLPDLVFPDTIAVTWDDERALADADVLVCAIPAQFLRQTWTRLRPVMPPGAGVVSVSKGIEVGTLRRPSQIMAETLWGADNPDGAPRPFASLSGPTIASELARRLPATMVAASDDPAFAERVQELFTTSWLRIYTNPDLLGVELAGAIKNVIAIAAGVLDGLRAGDNAKSALLARGLAEISRLGRAMGASGETFSGVAGVGDLATTCFSPEGRNRSCGEALGKGVTLADYLTDASSVVEGVETTRSVVALADRYRVEMPIARAVHAVLFESLDPVEAIESLMRRQPRDELSG